MGNPKVHGGAHCEANEEGEEEAPALGTHRARCQSFSGFSSLLSIDTPPHGRGFFSGPLKEMVVAPLMFPV